MILIPPRLPRGECKTCGWDFSCQYNITRKQRLERMSQQPRGTDALGVSIQYTGCLCCGILRELTKHQLLGATDGVSFHFEFGKGYFSASLFESFGYPTSEKWDFFLPEWVSHVRDEQNDYAKFTGSKGAMAVASSKLEDCKKDGSCGLRRFAKPERLIDVTFCYPDVRLVLTTDQSYVGGGSLDYFALSHCWGGTGENMRTLRGNIHSHFQRIAWEGLPLSFQDAINVTRQLGYRYLWIDSFCIIQDDPNDWAKEAMRMFDIYSSATLVLAAHHAKNSHGGLFTRIGKSREVRLALPSSNFESRSMPNLPPYVEMIGRRSDEVCPLTDTGEGKSTYEVAPLFTRAWVFQERLMSRRMLIFTASEMVWQCNDHISCSAATVPDSESFRALFQAVIAGKKPEVLPDGTFSVNNVRATPESARETRQNVWYTAVERYSDLSITKPDDKLPAIAAIARKLKESMRFKDDRYLAGLWFETFLSDMLWRVRPGRLHDGARGIDRILSARPHHPGSGGQPCWSAPTWSWASVQDPVSFMIHRYKHANHSPKLYRQCSINIHEIKTCAPGQDEFMLPARNLCRLPMEAWTAPAELEKLLDSRGRVYFRLYLRSIDDGIYIDRHQKGCRVHVDADPWPESGWEDVDPTHFYGGGSGGHVELEEEGVFRPDEDYDSDVDSGPESESYGRLSGYDSEDVRDLPPPQAHSTKPHWCKSVQLALLAYVTGVTDDSTYGETRHSDSTKRYIYMILQHEAQQTGSRFTRLGLARVDELDSTGRFFAKLKGLEKKKQLVIV